MKRLVVVYIAFSILFIAGCKKQQVDTFFITTKKNNINYSFFPAPTYTDKDSLDIFGSGPEESLYIRIKFNGLGKYILKEKQARYNNTIGSDVAISNYILDPTIESTFIITGYNSSGNIITGTFNIFMIRTYGNPETAYPKNLNFSNGKFRLHLTQ